METGVTTLTNYESSNNSLSKDIYFETPLPQNRNYGCVATVQQWISTYNQEPKVVVRSIDYDHVNLNLGLPTGSTLRSIDVA